MRKIEGVLLLALLRRPAAALAAPAPPPPLAGPLPASADLQARWATLALAQQHQVRARYAAWRTLPESERQRVRRAAAELAALPAAERATLQARFVGLDRLYRDGWRLGPQLGAAWPKLQPLLGYLPEAQREPMLALLRQLDASGNWGNWACCRSARRRRSARRCANNCWPRPPVRAASGCSAGWANKSGPHPRPCGSDEPHRGGKSWMPRLCTVLSVRR